ncbi:MAG: molybdopterin-guanine dinucleotide biosynthesis protein B [Chromatiales bacterium]|jgi:molybdopterin-guanine dinucleotide biosynthesis protein MobB
MIDFPVPILGIVAYSGTGKTTLLEKLIPCLQQQGLRIAAIKHSHHDFEIDKKGKDSDRLREAGAQQIVLASQYRTAVIIEGDRSTEPELQQCLARLDQDKLDLVLVEGFRQAAIPKLEVHRPSREKPILCKSDTDIIALVCDDKPAIDVDIPILPLNEVDKVCDFVLQHLRHLS